MLGIRVFDLSTFNETVEINNNSNVTGILRVMRFIVILLNLDSKKYCFLASGFQEYQIQKKENFRLKFSPLLLHMCLLTGVARRTIFIFKHSVMYATSEIETAKFRVLAETGRIKEILAFKREILGYHHFEAPAKKNNINVAVRIRTRIIPYQRSVRDRDCSSAHDRPTYKHVPDTLFHG